MTEYRAAMIGCGKIGSEFASDPLVKGTYTHAGAYAASSRVQLVAVCDANPVRLAACGDLWHVAARFTDAREMLQAVRPDILSVCSPDETHAAMIALALEHGVRAIVAEKPVAVDVNDARRIIGRASALGVPIVVNYTRRFADGHVRVSEMIKQDMLGDIQSVAGYYTKGVRHNGTHWFDLARFFFGEVADVLASASVAGDASNDPTLSVELRFDGGLRASLVGCNSAFSIFEMDIVWTRGRIRLIDSGHSIELYNVADSPHYSGYRSLSAAETWPGGMGEAMPKVIANCVACLDGTGVPVCSGQDGLAALEVAVASQLSSERRQRVAIK